MASYRVPLVGALLVSLVGITDTASAQVRYPEPPANYQITVHYRIRADRNARIRQYDDMMTFFEKNQFSEIEGPNSDLADVEPDIEFMEGKIPSDRARTLLLDRRVLSILVRPLETKLPDDLAAPVRVRIELTKGLPANRQRLLWTQVRDNLLQMGFADTIGYDHLGFSVLRGTVPTGVLNDLLNDARGLPGGWFLPDVSYNDVPEPLRSTPLAVRVIEVLAEPADAPAKLAGPLILPPVPADKPELLKLSPELRELFADPATLDKEIRVELMFDNTINMEGRAWRKRLLDAFGNLSIEGRLGNIVTLTAPKAKEIEALATIPEILFIRLPRNGAPALPDVGVNRLPPPNETPKEEPKKDAISPVQFVSSFDALSATKLSILHAQGIKGDKVRIVVIDNDFGGYPKFAATGGPLEKSKFIDLTAERNYTLLPDPMPHDRPSMGHGTHMALGAQYAAPNAEIIMVRVDGSAPHQVYSIAQAVLGETKTTEALLIRFQELQDDVNFINRRREIVVSDYQRAFDNFDDTPEAKAARKAAIDAVTELTKMEREYKARVDRLLALQNAIADLNGANVVISPLVWNSGQAINGFSPLSQYLDRSLTTRRVPIRTNVTKVRKVPVWFQAAGDIRSQGWTGLFTDRDQNGVMEFCESDQTPIPQERWTRELNFLTFQRDNGQMLQELPANSRIRIALQWQEAHDPDLPDDTDIYYRLPLADLQLLLLKQRDPSGKTVPSDEMELVAFAQSPPQRLAKSKEGAVYEQTIELTIPAAGRYAVRVHGYAPQGVRPVGLPSVPGAERAQEFRTRLFVEAVDDATRGVGRPIFYDYIAVPPGVGSPADALAVRTVGTAGPDGKPAPYSAFGAGPGLEMMYKPNILAYDFLPKYQALPGPARGTSLSTAFAGGTAATLISAGAPQSWILEALRIPPGHVFIVPDEWLRLR